MGEDAIMGAFDGVFETYRRQQSWKSLDDLLKEKKYLEETIQATSNRITQQWVKAELSIIQEIIDAKQE